MSRVDVDFDEFVRLNVDGLVRTAYMIVWDLREAEDLVQDSLFKVASSWSRVGLMTDPLAYTRKVLIHHALRQKGKHARRRAELEIQPHELGGEALALAGVERREELFSAVGQLPPRQRMTIVLRFYLDMSEAETARAMGCSVGTVKATHQKASPICARGSSRCHQRRFRSHDRSV
jgi:RNA polymerase sigma-70 factor (sigma-E family)